MKSREVHNIVKKFSKGASYLVIWSFFIVRHVIYFELTVWVKFDDIPVGIDNDVPGTLLSDLCSDCILRIVMNCPEISEKKRENMASRLWTKVMYEVFRIFPWTTELQSTL